MMNEPKNHNEFFVKCSNKKYGSQISEFAIDCKNCGSNFSPFVYSGQSIMMKGYYKCKRCKHWNYCVGDSMHTWNFDKGEPNICLKDMFDKF